MNIVNFIILFLGITYKKPRGQQAAPKKWFKALNLIIFSALALIIINSIPGFKYRPYIIVTSILPAVALGILVFSKPEFKNRAHLLFAWLPLVAIQLVSSLIKLFIPKIYEPIENFFDIGGIFAFIWAIAMSINNSRQTKKLEIERLKAIEKDRELERIDKLKKELEFQVEKRTKELSKQNVQLESALESLKASQEQLIQQEKLASLGQLTAGIAHEIKNPLNFVNNFSEISREMMQEVREEIKATMAYYNKPLPDNILHDMSVILDDIESNLEKIHYHGMRADGIVKSMLQHSRGGDGKMEPTDLNTLIKEYVNLAFHGMRAKRNPIDVEIDLQLDPEIKTVSLIGEDFTRVIINLTNNAFDAMRETANQRLPKLVVRTERVRSTSNPAGRRETNIIISIFDNGPGIPAAIKDKILQPFFTTKKGTEGTGLGLSITNDIIRAHGGKLEVSSTIGEGTKFMITLVT